MNEARDPGAGASWSRRRALRSGAALAAAGLAVTERATSAHDEHATPAAAEPVLPPDFKVVLHAAEEQHWPYVLSNLKNLTEDWPEAHLRVVVDGTAVFSLQGENVLTHELAELATAAVQVQACPNALHEHQISPDSIPAYVEVNLGGVAALVLAHREGYVYVKP